MTTSMLSLTCPPRRPVSSSAGAIGLFAAGVATQRPRFYPDDPIAREPESQDASKAAAVYDQSEMYELLYNLFVTSGYKPSGLRAHRTSTRSTRCRTRAGSPTASAARPVTNEELVRGAERRRAARSVEVGSDPGEDGRRASRLHGAGREGRDLVPGVRSAARPRRRDRRRGDRDEDLLGARLQPG